MANCCFYWLQCVSPSYESLDRLISIMKYEDPEWYIYRVRECSPEPINHVEGLYFVSIQGEVAWSTHSWLDPIRDDERANSEDKTIYTNLVELSKLLDISFFCFAEEDSFAEAFHIHKGQILLNVSTDLCDPGDMETEYFEENVESFIEECKCMGYTDADLKELYDAVNEEMKKNVEERCLYVRAGGYDWRTYTVHDIYSDEAIVPVKGGINIDN